MRERIFLPSHCGEVDRQYLGGWPGCLGRTSLSMEQGVCAHWWGEGDYVQEEEPLHQR